MDGMNKTPEGGDIDQSVDMDGMNKTPEGGDIDRPVAMNGMNKTPCGGEGNFLRNQATVIPTIPPNDLQEFSTSCIFNAPEDLPAPVAPLGPFLTSKDIKLSKGEKKLLSKDPKFSLVFPPTVMKLSTEIERMNAKTRYNNKTEKFEPTSNHEKVMDVTGKEKRCRITDTKGNPIDWNGYVGQGEIEDHKPELMLEALRNRDIDDDTAKLFMKCKDRFIYNPVSNHIDFTTRRATDYKLNRNVNLPKPMDSEKELQCELRRTSYLKAFNTYRSKLQIKKEAEELKRKEIILQKMKKRNKRKGVDSKCMSNKIKGNDQKYEKASKDPVNLTRKEIQALKSLRERVMEGEIIVCQTDKSSRFAVLTKQQYLDSGRIHTEKDKKITWKDIKYIQSQVNNHVWWLSHILGYAEKTDSSRMLKNLQNHSLEVPDMALLVKDHKQWRPDTKKPVPTRPVVSGNRGVNTHLSEIISEFLEPLIMEMGGGEVSSTEEALNAITRVNDLVENKTEPDHMNILQSLAAGSRNGLISNMSSYSLDGGEDTNGPVVMDGMNKETCKGGRGIPLPPN